MQSLLWFVTSAILCSLCESFAGMPGFSPVYMPCDPGFSVDSAPVSSGGVTLQLEGDASSYDPERMYQVTLASTEAFNYVVIKGILSSGSGESGRGDHSVRSSASTSTCAMIYTFMSPVATRTISFFYMSPPSGSGCTLLTVMASTWNRMIQAESPLLRLCESPPRISTSPLNLNLNQGVAFFDDFDSGPLEQKWNSDESSIETGTSCGQITSGTSLSFCSSSAHITSHPVDLTSATYVIMTIGQGSCRGDGLELDVSYRDVTIDSTGIWNLLHSELYESSSIIRQLLIPIPDEAKTSNVELRLSTGNSRQVFLTGGGGSSQCLLVDDVIITTSDQLPVDFYDDFESDDPLNWLWKANSFVASSCGRDDVIAIDDVTAIDDSYLMTRDIDLSGGAGVRTKITDLNIKAGKRVDSGTCGHIGDDVTVMDHKGQRSICTGGHDLSGVDAIELVISVGNTECSDTSSGDDESVDLTVSSESPGSPRQVVRTFEKADFIAPTKVLLKLPGNTRKSGQVICLQQRSAMSSNQDVWTLSDLSFVSSRPDTEQYFVQFSFNLNCGGSQEDSELDFQYSNDLGTTWETLHSECLPETCTGNHFIHHTVFDSTHYSGWTRVSFPLPQSALSPTTRFRWITSGTSWSIDDVYIGSDVTCPRFCSGHGSCTRDGCRCDEGWTGDTCGTPSFPLIDFLSEGFSSNEINSTSFSQARGVEVGFACGIVGFGKSLLFNGEGIRYLTTQPLDARSLRYLQFSVVLGSNSPSGDCVAPQQPGEGVLVQYSVDGGVTWQLLQLIPYNSNRVPGIVTIPLPSEAQQIGLLVRWYQPNRDVASNQAVWALDDVTVTSKLFRTAYSQSVNFHLGQIQQFCDRFPVLAFTEHLADPTDVRYAETQSLQISSGYVMQADIVIGCGLSDVTNTVVKLQYSVDHGKTWSLVYQLSIPGSTTSQHYHQASEFYANQYPVWTRRTIPLPPHTWSESTRFRLIDEIDSGSWAVDNVYIGPGCADLCHNHGYCEHGVCTCDPGYSGPSCLPDQALPRGLDVTFDDVGKLGREGWTVYGGGESTSGCGTMTGSTFLHFDQQGVRMMVTPDLDTTEGRQIQFFVQIAGGGCGVSGTGRGTGVLVQVSTDGGNTWLPLQELYYDEYKKATFVHLPLPPHAMTSHTRFRWWQPQHGGAGYDAWSVDDVIIGEMMMADDDLLQVTSVPLQQEALPTSGALSKTTQQLRGVGSMESTFLGFGNRGLTHEFCSPRKNALVFNGVQGDRFATTDDVFLTLDDVIQFEINVGCTLDFDYTSPVMLEFSHDGGVTWDIVRRACYPRGQYHDEHHVPHLSADVRSHTCTGSARQLAESSRYHPGDYEVWRRIVIPVTRDIASKLVRFRWFQQVDTGSPPAPWAIDTVYIGPACPSNCNGHGSCVRYPKSDRSKCVCDKGFQESRFGGCQPIKPHRSGILEKFESPQVGADKWNRVYGGIPTSHAVCGVVYEGQALQFDGVGTRKIQTKAIDTTNTRLIQFYLRIGSDQIGGSCQATDRNEGVVFQYSTDNGINWKLIKDFSFQSHNSESPQLVSIQIPYMAQTASTSFRWWQPLRRESDSRATWSLDNIFVGVANMLSNGFYEDFDSYLAGNDLENFNWYKLQSGQVAVALDQCSADGPKKIKGQSLVLNSQSGSPSYAETWDFHLMSGTFIQFELKANCIDRLDDVIRLEYSIDMGASYQLVKQPCLSEFRTGCDYDMGSIYHASLNRKWTRHSVYLTDQMRTSTVRFRWIRYSTSGGNSTSQWAIDNIYIGNKCDWMCAGHGSCAPSTGSQFACKCDEGFSTLPNCQPASLDQELKEDFDGGTVNDNIPEIVGGSVSDWDLVVSGNSLQMSGSGIRLVQTRPMDTTDAQYVQFNLKFPQTGAADNYHEIVVQSTINNGITWITLKELHPTYYDDVQFVHINLPDESRYQSTSIRILQPDLYMELHEDSWSIDNLYIGGSVSSCPLRNMDEHFQPITLSNWLFHPGGSVNEYCQVDAPNDPYSVEEEAIHSDTSAPVDLSLRFGGIGDRSITTKDLCLCENSVIQFKISIGCSLDRQVTPSSSGAVRLEVSHDYGAMWQLVQPSCHGSSTSLDASCGSERREASVYFPGSFDNWRTVVIPLKDKKHVCSQGSNKVRFRWTQGQVRDGRVVQWAIDDVYIGEACTDSCNGHGICELDPDGVPQCHCNVGYVGESCKDPNSNPTFFMETFDPSVFESSEEDISASLWHQMTGGQISSTDNQCHPDELIFSRRKFDMKNPGTRSLMTIDIDTSLSTFIQFYMKQDTCPDAECEIQTEPVYLQYTKNGGLYWNTLEKFPFQKQKQSKSTYHVILLDEQTRDPSTSFRWWSPSVDGNFRLNWSVDHIVIGSDLSQIDDDFSRNQPETWIAIQGGRVESSESSTTCPLDGGHLRLGGHDYSGMDCGTHVASTVGTTVGLGTFIQFKLFADCLSQPPSGSCHDISLEYSLDHGHTWQLVKEPCHVDDYNCDDNHAGTIYKSDQFSGGNMNRVAFMLPASTHSPSTRFRWKLPQEVTDNHWIVDDVNVGRDCPRACSGHGSCHNKACKCDDGWTGSSCKDPVHKLPASFKDNFDPATGVEPSLDQYSILVGADMDAMCGTVGFKRALHFYKGCSRMLVTSPLDTSDADFLQFLFRFGCRGNLPFKRDHSVMVDWTPNNGVVWINLAEIYFADYNEYPGYVNIFLPDRAKRVGVQFRWKQQSHEGEYHQDWAIDNLHIGGDHRGKYLSDLFVMDAPAVEPKPLVDASLQSYGLYLDRDDKDMWRFYDNTRPSSFCGRDNVVLAGTRPGLDTSVGTKDFIASEDYILQYTIVVLCEDIQEVHQPVHVQASTDFGDTWEYLVPQCLPSDGECFVREIVQPSAHFISPDWRRRTIKLPLKFVERPVRFRFIQFESDVVWALDHFYVGPTCPDACSGRGNCVSSGEAPYCECDDGYHGDNCELDHVLRTYAKDTYNSGQPINDLWEIVEAEKVGLSCGPLSDGDNLYFDGVGPRQIVSRELNLQDARFVQYKVVIGGDGSSCLPSKGRGDGLLMQYSTDGGISWKMLLELDYLSYRDVGIDYVTLPLEARTSRTMIRLWQPFVIDDKTGLATMGFDRATWAIDDVYIGGNDVNLPLMQSHFDAGENPSGNLGQLPDELFDFHPKGQVGEGVCGLQEGNRAIWWPNTGSDSNLIEQSLITRQLIVSSNHIIQFKIRMGCGDDFDRCDRNFGVSLEYREDPSTNDWRLVREDCYPAAPPNPQCTLFENWMDSVYRLDEQGGHWSRITIPLDHLESSTMQFRWRQSGSATSQYSWSIDDVYVGERCDPNFCGGHGDCVAPGTCKCDPGFTGPSCHDVTGGTRHHDFKDNFEVPAKRGPQPPQKWTAIDGGQVGIGGCGSLRPYGFGRSAYFNGCGRRALQTVEMDLTRAGHVQYVIQIGSAAPGSQTGCRVYTTSGGLVTSNSSVLLQYSTNNGVTWMLVREHLVRHHVTAKRLSVPVTNQMRTTRTTLRWLQPYHNGVGYDQWAIDNVEIVMTRQNRHLHQKDSSRRRSLRNVNRRHNNKKPRQLL